MHYIACTHDSPTKNGADALLPKTDTENGQLARKVLDHRHGNAGFGRRAGPRRDANACGHLAFDLLETDPVIAMYLYLSTQLPQVLHHVPSEGVIVVDH